MNSERSGIDIFEDAYLGASENLITGLTEGAWVIDPKEREKILISLTEENKAHTAILNKLNKEGLERRGVVPTAFFQNLVTHMQLYTFKTMDGNGRVKADIKNYIEASQSVSWGRGIIAHFLGSLLIVSYIIHAYHPGVYSFSEVVVFGFALGCARFLLAFILTLMGIHLLGIICLTEFIAISFFKKRKTSDEIKRLLWKSRSDTDIQKQFFTGPASDKLTEANKLLEETTACITMDPVPERMQERLSDWRAAGYDPYLVVDEKAFGIVLDGLLKKSIRKIIALRDPMYCVDINGFIVIIDQYGPFPSEQEMVAFVEHQYVLRYVENDIISYN